jgi:HD-GYP domain-containing protein (c-di-GMP phosphodiesterase class II)/DNA-binding CsgD family transcriptional regulator
VPRTQGVAPATHLAEVVAAIALAADLGLGQPVDHVLRSCVIATRFADALGVSPADRDATYWVTLFLTAGCTGASFELSQVFGDDIAFRAGVFDVDGSTFQVMRYVLGYAGSGRSQLGKLKVRASLLASRMTPLEQSFLAHCAVSARIAERLGLGESVVASLWQTFARWDGKGMPKGLRGSDILLPVQIANIANLVEVREREQGAAASSTLLRRFAGTSFDPKLVDAWCRDADSIVAGVEVDSAWKTVVSDAPATRGPLTEAELDAALELLADYADLKSPYFTGHSRGVSGLAASAAREAGLPDGEVTTLRRAALVHDIGRNGVPNSIWDRPGPLTATEMERVRLHAYYTERVLRHSGGLAPLAAVGGAAHERGGGTGYPHGATSANTPLLARFLAAADAYHAMLEGRPHRPALSRDQAGAELRRMARTGELAGGATDAVLAAAGHPTRRKPSAPGGLTAREVEVLMLTARGGTAKAVGLSLGIAPKTVGNHIERIYMKAGISTRAEAAMFAMQHGLVNDWESVET